MLKSASRDKCNFVKLRYRCWSNILTDSMLRVSRYIRSDTLSTAFYQHCQWRSKCINASRRTAFYLVKFRAVRARQVSGIFWSWKTILSSFNELYAVRKNVIPSFVSPAASLKLSHASWKVNALFLSESAIWNDLRTPVPSSLYTYYWSIVHGALY